MPGGKASYPSTVLMTATLAQVAGVENIVVVTPPQPNGVSQEVLAACYITQVNQVFSSWWCSKYCCIDLWNRNDT